MATQKKSKEIKARVDSENAMRAFATETGAYEAFEPKRYWDKIAGKWTIGHGFNLDAPSTANYLTSKGYNVAALKSGKAELTEDQSLKLLNDLFIQSYDQARNFVPNFDTLPEKARYILADMTYNMGYPKLTKFAKMQKALSVNDFNEAAVQLKDSDYYKQVGRRSKAHYNEFLELRDAALQAGPTPTPTLTNSVIPTPLFGIDLNTMQPTMKPGKLGPTQEKASHIGYTNMFIPKTDLDKKIDTLQWNGSQWVPQSTLPQPYEPSMWENTKEAVKGWLNDFENPTPNTNDTPIPPIFKRGGEVPLVGPPKFTGYYKQGGLIKRADGSFVEGEGEYLPVDPRTGLPVKNLKGVEVTADAPDTYNNYMLKKHRNDGLAEAMFGMPLDYVFGFPQAAATKFFSGKYQTPSEAMDIQNPYLAAGVDMFADPTNLIGVGLLNKEKALARLVASKESGVLSNAYKVNPWANKIDPLLLKTNPEAYYRGIGKSGYDDLLNNKILRSRSNAFPEPYFVKGSPPDAYSNGYIAELKNEPVNFKGFGYNQKSQIFTSKPINVENENLKIYKNTNGLEYREISKTGVPLESKKHWLKGYKEVPKQLPGSPNAFKSEINWGNWNKEIPENKDLMNEYSAIEQQAKADGTWMKNPDGSEFTGTPEQFIQQNSSNFKKAYPNGFEITYRGTDSRGLNTENLYKNYPNGRGIFTGDLNTAKHYATKEGTLYELYHPKSSNSYDIDVKNRSWREVPTETLPGIKTEKTFLGKPVADTDDIATWAENNNVDYVNMRNIFDGVDAKYSRVVNNKPGNFLKSMFNNNGMFDMTNPNIYKGLVPAGIFGAGMYEAQGMQQQRDGGWVDMYNAGSWVEDMSLPQPTTPPFYPAGEDRTLTNYQMGTDKAPMYAAGSTVWTNQDTPLWAAGSTTPTSTQNFRNTGSLNTSRYRIGDVIPTGMDYKTPSAGTHDYNQDIQPPKKMVLHAPDTTRMGNGSHVTSAYKKRVGIPYAISPGVSNAGMYVGPTTQRGVTFANGGYIQNNNSNTWLDQYN